MKTGIEALRDAVQAFNYCNETFLGQFSVEELLTLRKLWLKSAWDVYPDDWTRRQVCEAVSLGLVPAWDDEERPVYWTSSDGSDLWFMLREAVED
jgi:hypothetical protein